MSDIRSKQAALEKMGFTVGKRDARLNTDFGGAFMVVEAHDESELPTRDGRNGPWCIVGDDLDALINEAFDSWEFELRECGLVNDI